MNLLQRLIYAILKAIVYLVVHAYYPRIAFSGKARLKLKGPTIVAGNHPNTLMDALNGALWVDQPVFFLAMARLFKPDWAGKILRFLFCIPLERRKDNNGGPVNNEDTFKLAIDHLSAGRHLFIAPDGGNELERNLLPIKTGAARIALAAEQSQQYQLGLQFLPLGYTYYGDRAQFGTEMLIEVGEPFTLQEFAATNEQDHQAAVRNLTAFLEKRMQDLLLNVRDEEEDQRLHVLEEILRDQAPLPLPAFFRRSKRLLQQLRNLEIEQPDIHQAFVQQVQTYARLLQANRIPSSTIYWHQANARIRAQRQWSFWALLPIWFFAWLNHWPLLALCRWAVRKLDLHIGYRTTVELCVGLIALPVLYALQSNLIAYLSNATWSWVYLLALVLTGRIATKNKRLIDSGLAYYKLSQWPQLKAELLRQRQQISAQLDQLLSTLP